MKQERILILDFGGHFNQLVARKVRECFVYSEVVDYTYPVEDIIKYKFETLEKWDKDIIEFKMIYDLKDYICGLIKTYT